jgi:uncharacterized protein (DUF849 family)
MDAQLRRIKVCLNGGRSRAEHPAVPVTPAQLAAEAAAGVAAGAEAIHLHPRGGDGAESLLAGEVGAAVGAVRRACPGIPVGVSTGLWITGGDAGARRAAVAEWTGLGMGERPDFASVNLSEPDVADLLPVLEAAGVAAEAGVWSIADARIAAAAGPPAGWLRLLVEVTGATAAGALGMADEILRELDELDVAAPRLLHGENETCWPLIRRSGQLGLATRIGLEDTITGPGGEPVSGNAELIRQALTIWDAAAVDAR